MERKWRTKHVSRAAAYSLGAWLSINGVWPAFAPSLCVSSSSYAPSPLRPKPVVPYLCHCHCDVCLVGITTETERNREPSRPCTELARVRFCRFNFETTHPAFCSRSTRSNRCMGGTFVISIVMPPSFCFMSMGSFCFCFFFCTSLTPLTSLTVICESHFDRPSGEAQPHQPFTSSGRLSMCVCVLGLDREWLIRADVKRWVRFQIFCTHRRSQGKSYRIGFPRTPRHTVAGMLPFAVLTPHPTVVCCLAIVSFTYGCSRVARRRCFIVKHLICISRQRSSIAKLSGAGHISAFHLTHSLWDGWKCNAWNTQLRRKDAKKGMENGANGDNATAASVCHL